jgi:hypothetical protein
MFQYEDRYGYELLDSLLLLRFDINGDGDYQDDGETMEFIREDK